MQLKTEKLADTLQAIGEQLRERWRQTWEEQSEQQLRNEREAYYPYAQEETNGFAPVSNKARVLGQPKTFSFANSSTVFDQSTGTSGLKIHSAIAVSAHNLYPAYYERLIEALRDGDLSTFWNFMQAEGAKWALVEVPVEELMSENICYGQEVVDLIYNNPDLNLSQTQRREAVQAFNEVNRQGSAALLEGYVEGHDRLVVRVLSSNRPEESTIKGAVLGGVGEQVRRSLDELEALHKVNSAVNSSLDLNSVLNLTVQAVTEVMSVDVCAVYVFERESGDAGKDDVAGSQRLKSAQYRQHYD